MQVARIKNADIVLNAPKDWKQEDNGPCLGLPIRKAIMQGTPFMVSAWEPTPEELKKIIAGETIKLWVQGWHSHPVVAMSVGDIE